MNVEEKNNELYKKALKGEKSIFKKLLKIFLYFFGGIIILLISLIILLQTTFFKSWVLHIAIDKINNSFVEKDSHFFAETLEGNIITGIRLKNVGAIVKQDTMFHIDELDVNYSLSPLLRQYIDAKNVILINPQINLTKIPTDVDTLWNIAYLLKGPPKPKDTTKAEFKWKINAENVEIINLNFRMLDFKSEPIPIRQIYMESLDSLNLNHLDVRNFDMKVSGFYSKDEKKGNIEYLKFKSNTALDSVYLTLKASIDKNTSINDFTLVTGRSNMNIYKVNISDFNILDGFSFKAIQNKEVNLSLNFDKVDYSDLTFFIPKLKFITGKYYLNLEADGKYSDLNIKNLNIKTELTNLNLNGTLKDLNEPSKMFFDVKLSNSTINPGDAKIYLPGIPIPDFSNVGLVYADIEYYGKVKEFSSKFDVKSSAGNASGNANIDFSKGEFIYSGDVKTSNVNPGAIFKDNTLQGKISGNFKVEGKGFDYRTMNAKLNYNLSNTSFFGFNVAASSGTVDLNNGNANINLNYSGSAGNIAAVGSLNFHNLSSISYNLKGTCQNLNLSELTKNSEQTSNLNFAYDLQGEGLDINTLNFDKLNTDIKLDVLNSTYAKYFIPETPINITLKSDTTQKSFVIASNFIDADFRGRYSYKTLPEVFAVNIQDISEKTYKRINAKKDSTTYISEVLQYTSDTSSSIARDTRGYINMAYKINVKNLNPFKSIIGDSITDFRGSIEGKVLNRQRQFGFKSDAFISSFVYKDSLFKLKNATLSFNINNNLKEEDISSLKGDLAFNSVNTIASGMKIDSVSINIDMNNYSNKFNIFTKIDSLQKLKTDGEISFESDRISAFFDTLSYTYKNMLIGNPERLIVHYLPLDSLGDTNNISFEKFSLTNKNQKFEILGRYSLAGNSDLQINAQRIQIEGLFALFSDEARKKSMVSGNIRRLAVNFKGTLQEPDINIEMNSDPLRINRSQIGRADAIIFYKNNSIKPELSLFNPSNEGSLRVTGDIPYKNPLNKANIDTASFLKQEVNLNILADNYQLKILEQFIPAISGLDAKLMSQLNISGSVESPLLTGNMKVDNGRFKLIPTGVTHGFNCNINADNTKLLLDYFRLYYPDDPTRFFTFAGYIDLAGLKLNDIDISVNGDCKLLVNEVNNNTLGVYGDLLVGSGSNNIRLKGNQEQLSLTGDVILKKGKVFIPQFQKDAYSLYRDNITYNVIIDSNKFSVDSLKLLYTTFLDTMNGKSNYIEDPFDFALSGKQVVTNEENNSGKIKKSTFFVYDLTVKSDEDIYFRFIIDDKTKMEVFGDVGINNMFVKNDNPDGKLDVRGTLDVKDNSTFKFYKNFKASGTVSFNGDVSNPNINMTAIYSATESGGESQNSKNIDIYLTITGTIMNMNLKWRIDEDGSQMASTDPTGDAMSFIIFGRFASQLNSSQRVSLVSNVGANVGTAYISNYVSSFLQSYMPFILSTDINYVDTYGGTVAQNTDIRITAGLGDFKIQLGGQILSDISNTNFIIEYPLSKLFNFKGLTNNLILRMERLVDPFSQNSLISLDNRLGGAIIYKIKF